MKKFVWYGIFITNATTVVLIVGGLATGRIRHCSIAIFPWKSMWLGGADRDGGIFPDRWCIKPIGNIFKDNLLEVWNNKKMQEYYQKIAKNDFSLCNKECTYDYIFR